MAQSRIPTGNIPLAVYELLEQAAPAKRMEIVMALVTRRGMLELPARDGVQANLSYIDLSRETLQARLERMQTKDAPWWESLFQGANLLEANLQGANLTSAKLQGAYLDSAKLQGANLMMANLQGAHLNSAKLQGANLMMVNLQEAKLGKADLEKADLSQANLQEAELLLANLEEANLSEANLHGAALQGANLQKAQLSRANFQGANLRNAKLQGAFLWEARLEGADLTTCELALIFINGAYLDQTRLRREQLERGIGEEGFARWFQGARVERAEWYNNAKYGYLALKQNFEDLGDYDAASWAYRKEREMERLEAKYSLRILKYITDTLQWLFTGYGESVARVLGAIVLIFLVFAVGYWLTGSVERPGGGSVTWADYALFSLSGMTTQDAAHLSAANESVEVFVRLEALLSIALTGLLGFVLGNRIRHS